ncbi:MAG TPA: hypothetical protein VLU25_12300 [Acidobacteriota bacterium]|nr:hypothetical protein [Acidobacteriota bacterium]
MSKLSGALRFALAVIFCVAALRWISAIILYVAAFMSSGMDGVYSRMAEDASALAAAVVSMWSDIDGIYHLPKKQVLLITLADALITLALGVTLFKMFRRRGKN